MLGIERNVTKSEVRRAYRRLSTTMHPDKNPNDPNAKEAFRKVGEAYEVLTDDAKRAKYEDFLDNPTKYWQYLMENARDNYAPKSNVFLVIVGLFGIFTLINWFNMKNEYKQTIRRMRESVEFKRQVTKLIKSKQAATPEEAELLIELDVVGLEEPHWRNLVIVKTLQLFPQFGKWILWNLKWVVNYRLLKKEYSDEDKLYLIQKNMKLDSHAWNALNINSKALYLEKELWDSEKCDEFLRIERIELNRAGKGKKKKKHAAVPYSEVEEVKMD